MAVASQTNSGNYYAQVNLANGSVSLPLGSDNTQNQLTLNNGLTNNQTAQHVQNTQPVDQKAVGQTSNSTKSAQTIKIQVNSDDPIFHIRSKLMFCDREIEFSRTLVDTGATNCFINFKFLPPDI